jgi:hypothetical protein
MEKKDGDLKDFVRSFSELKQTTDLEKFVHLSFELVKNFGIPAETLSKGLGSFIPIKHRATQLVIPFTSSDKQLFDIRLNKNPLFSPDSLDSSHTTKELYEKRLAKGEKIAWGLKPIFVDASQFQLLVAQQPEWVSLTYTLYEPYNPPKTEKKGTFFSSKKSMRMKRYAISFADKSYKKLESYDPYTGDMISNTFSYNENLGQVDKKWNIQETTEHPSSLEKASVFLNKFLPILSNSKPLIRR